MGYRLVDVRNIHDDKSFIERIKKAGFLPRTVIDVGVAYGTEYLYSGFPESKFILVDPTRESLPHMQKWREMINAEIYNFALGSANRKIKIRTRDTIQHSTLLMDSTKPDIKYEYEVEMYRFDSLEIELSSPVLLKIDVEGYELEVLKGLGDRLTEIDILIVETSLVSLYDNGSSSSEVINFMEERNFRVFDVAGITRRPFDNTIHQIDYCFCREGTSFYLKRWV